MIDKQCDFIKEVNADVICLQEVLNDNYISQEKYLTSKFKPYYNSFIIQPKNMELIILAI